MHIWTYVVVKLSLDCFVFFFSSRRRHTRCSRDWSSDVCSSDLCWIVFTVKDKSSDRRRPHPRSMATTGAVGARSEERRVGKGVDLGGRRIIKKKKIK